MPFRAVAQYKFGEQLFTNIGGRTASAGGAAMPRIALAGRRHLLHVAAGDQAFELRACVGSGSRRPRRMARRGRGRTLSTAGFWYPGRTRGGCPGELVALPCGYAARRSGAIRRRTASPCWAGDLQRQRWRAVHCRPLPVRVRCERERESCAHSTRGACRCLQARWRGNVPGWKRRLRYRRILRRRLPQRKTRGGPEAATPLLRALSRIRGAIPATSCPDLRRSLAADQQGRLG